MNCHKMLGDSPLYRFISKYVKLFLPHEVNIFIGTHLVFHKSVWLHIFHIRNVHLDNIKVFYSPNDAQVIVLRSNLNIFFKFTLKYLRHVSAQSHHHQGGIIRAS
jgi:hypothetical protein